MSAEVLLSGFAGLALVALSGRVALAWLPPGSPGSQRPARWAETWAASHALGLIVLHALLVVASALDLRWSFTSLGVLLAAAVLVQVASGPGSMVPRRTLPQQRAGLPARLALLAVVLLTFVPIFASAPGFAPSRLEALSAWSASAPWQSAPFRLLAPASRVALVVLLLHGLECGRVRPLARRAITALVLALPCIRPLEFWASCAVWGDSLQPALLLLAGGAFTVAWRRRADPRAGTLAALCFAAAPAYEREAWPLGLAGLLILIALTHRNARRSVLRACAVGLLLSAPAFATWPLEFT